MDKTVTSVSVAELLLEGDPEDDKGSEPTRVDKLTAIDYFLCRKFGEWFTVRLSAVISAGVATLLTLSR